MGKCIRTILKMVSNISKVYIEKKNVPGVMSSSVLEKSFSCESYIHTLIQESFNCVFTAECQC